MLNDLIVNLDNKVIESIQRLGEKHAVEKIVLFGSRARGENEQLAIKICNNINVNAAFLIPGSG